VKPTANLLFMLFITLAQMHLWVTSAVAVTDKDYLLFYSNAVIGEIEPCG